MADGSFKGDFDDGAFGESMIFEEFESVVADGADFGFVGVVVEGLAGGDDGERGFGALVDADLPARDDVEAVDVGGESLTDAVLALGVCGEAEDGEHGEECGGKEGCFFHGIKRVEIVVFLRLIGLLGQIGIMCFRRGF